MIPSKPPKNESRRSSILKACKPRQPLQNVNINSSSNENSPTTSKVKRRVSFADKKHVKKFCNSMEQGTVWDMTYEDNCVDAAIEIASSPPYNHDLTCYLSDASTIEVFDDVKDDLDGITPIEHVDVLNQELPLRQVIPPQASKSTSSNVDTIYTDRDKENYAGIISNVYYPKMYTSEVNSELDRTRVQDLSMEFTAMISTVYCDDKQKDVQKDNVTSHQDNLDTNCTMELTKVVSRRSEAENFDLTSKQENIYREKDMNSSITFTQKTSLLCKSMDITEVVSAPVSHENICNIDHAAEALISNCDNESMEITEAVPISVKPTRADMQAFRVTEFFRDTSMQMTKPIDTILSANVYNKENLRTDEPVLRENKDTFSYNTSMEMTEAILSRNREEMFDPVTHEKNIRGRQNMNNSITFNERTELLRKSMDITEAVSNPVEREKTHNIKNIVESAETLIPYATTVLRTHLPTENSAGSPLHADPAVNNDETIDNISMEITAAVQSHRTESPTLNRTENLNVSRNESQCPTASNTAEFKKSETRENVQISRETTETTNLHDALSDTRISTNKLDHPLSATLTNAGKRMSSHENENTNAKKFCSGSFVECQLSAVRYNAHSSSRADDKYVSKERSTDDTIHPARTSILPSESRASDSLNETDECSFLRQNLENSFIELLSINPPSFVCMSSQEENSMSKVLKEDELHASNTAEAVPINDKNHSSEKLEPTNIEYDETKDCHRSIVKNTIKNKRETEVIEKTIDDNRVDESNRYATDAEHLNEESTPSMSSLSRGVTVPDTDRFADTKVTRTDQVDEEEHIREEINDEVELRNMEQEEQHSKVEEECCADHLEETEATIEDRVDRDEYCQENSNGKVDPQSMEQRENYVKERPDTEQCVNKIEEESLVEQDPFLSLTQKLETYAESDDCIWSVYYKNVDRKMIAFGFISNSLLIVTFLSDNLNDPEENSIKRIKIVSRLAHDSSELSWIVHRLIMEKINMETLSSYRTHEDILPMLDFVSRDVILAMDFIFDLKSLDKLNLMEIARDKISFLTRSKNLDIILKITINVKRFDKLTPSDISIHRILGTIREEEVKYLIKNVRKDHKFLRRYMNDVRDYVDIMEQISVTSNSLGQIVKIRKNP